MELALLVIDVQPMIVERISDGAKLLARMRKAIDGARESTVPVIFVRLWFRAGYPEISPRNRMFSALSAAVGDGFQADSAGTQIHPDLGAEPDDHVVTKRRVSGFSGSDLDVLLRSLGVAHIVLCGLVTGGAITSTLREAADRDYEITVLADACDDLDPEVHRVLMEKLFPRQADVVTVDDWVASL